MSKRVWKIKKKHHKGWIIFGVLMTVFVVLPIAFVFGAFYDPTTKKVSDSDVHYENLVSETFYKGLENLGDTGELKFTIDEEMIDGIMMSACDKINQKNFIPKMYCEINGNNYDFFVDLKALFFKSRVIIHTSLTHSETEILTFNIKGITIGRLPLPISWVTGIAGNFINDDMLNKTFEGAGFRIKSHLAQAKLTYSKEDFKEDIGTYVEKLAGNNDYLNLLLNVIGDNSNLFSADYKGGVSATIKLHDLSTPAGYRPLLTYQAEELAKYKSSIANWLTSGHLKEKDEGVEDSRDRVADVFSFLIRGYDLSSNEVKAFIDSIDGTPLYTDISECTHYTDLKECKGCVVAINGSTPPTTFKDYCGSANELNVEIYPDSLPDSFSVTLDGNEMNKYLANTMTEAIGMNIPITYKSGDQWNFEYIFIDNFFVNFEGSGEALKMDIYLSLNVSGYPICIKLSNQDIDIKDADASKPTVGNLAFVLKEVSFGSISIKPEQFSWLDDLLTKMQGESFTYDKNNHRFLISLDNFVDDQYKNRIAAIVNAETVERDFSATNNELNLTFSVNS